MDLGFAKKISRLIEDRNRFMHVDMQLNGKSPFSTRRGPGEDVSYALSVVDDGDLTASIVEQIKRVLAVKIEGCNEALKRVGVEV